MKSTLFDKSGFTLIELLIAMAVTAIIMTAAITAFWNTQSVSSNVDQRSNMAMSIRNTVYLIEDQIRLMGFDPRAGKGGSRGIQNATGGILRFERKDPEDEDLINDIGVRIGLEFSGATSGNDIDGLVDSGHADGGVSRLVINIGGGGIDENDIATDNIRAIRFAYAFDANGDGSVDLSPNGNVIWAIDANGNGRLDTVLDTNDDGEIDLNDTTNGAVMGDVNIRNIRAVKVWLLARSPHPLRGGGEGRTFVLGDQRDTPGDNHAYTLYTTTIRCPNMF